MRTFYFLIFFISVTATSTLAQVSNALHFDNFDDAAIAFNATSLVIDGEITLAFWVNSANETGAFPDYEGFAGIRNNDDADFYILKLGANEIEARFRNSEGTVFDITGPFFIPNQWQHYVFTYNGSEIKLYVDGVLEGTTPASGAITNPSQNFQIGKLEWTGNPFYLDGAIDEIGLWNRAITQQEVTCIYDTNIPNNSQNLQLHYSCDQGIVNSDNTNISILTDSKGNLDAQLTNFELLSETSNFVAGNTPPINILINYLCLGVPYVLGANTYTEPGFYYATLEGDCGENILLQLYDALDTLLQVNNNTLNSVLPNATYQWKNCDSGQFVIGATAQSFTPTQTGVYQLVITANGCTAASSCYALTVVTSNTDLNDLGISLAPVPAQTETVLFDAFSADRTFRLVAADGRTLSQGAIESQHQLILLDKLNSGTYWIQVWDNSVYLGALPVIKL